MRDKMAELFRQTLLNSDLGFTEVRLETSDRVHASAGVELRAFRKPTLEDLEDDLFEDGFYHVTDEPMTYEQACAYYREEESDMNRFWFTVSIENDADMD
jgi:hypothetical protein